MHNSTKNLPFQHCLKLYINNGNFIWRTVLISACVFGIPRPANHLTWVWLGWGWGVGGGGETLIVLARHHGNRPVVFFELLLVTSRCAVLLFIFWVRNTTLTHVLNREYVCVRARACTYVCVCMQVCVCMYVCIIMCIYICMCVYVYVHTHTHAYTRNLVFF